MNPNAIEIGPVNESAETLLPPETSDGSGVGVNFVDAWLESLRTTLDDGRKLRGTRRGLEVTLELGGERGKGLLRRLEHGPDPRIVLRHALDEAGQELGARIEEREGRVYLIEATAD